jgi:hypothetical protein
MVATRVHHDDEDFMLVRIISASASGERIYNSFSLGYGFNA